MSKVQLSGNPSGTGVFTIASPNSNIDRTLTLPDLSGTIATTGAAVTTAQLPVGTVLQVVSANTTTNVSTTSSSFVDTGLSASITPTNSANRILVIVSQTFFIQNNVSGRDECLGRVALLRGATSISEQEVQMGITNFGNPKRVDTSQSITIYDSPNTTSSVTYKTQMRTSGFELAEAQRASSRSSITLIEIKS